MLANATAQSTTPKPSWSLGLHAAVSRIEKQTKECLTDYVGDRLPLMCLLLDMKKVEGILRASAAESFEAQAAFYRSQTGCCREWLEEAATDTIASTLNLVPWNLAASSCFQEALPRILAILRAGLEELLTKSSGTGSGAATAFMPARRKRGRPTVISNEAKEQALEAQAQGADPKQIAALLYGVQRPTSRQTKDAGKILKYYCEHIRQAKKS